MATTSIVKTDSPYGNKKTIQSKFSAADIKDKLKGYVELPLNKLKNIEPGDDIRYMTNNAFKSGGRVKSNKFPEYVVLMNVFKKLSWCVQYRDPTLKIWIKTKEMREKEQEKKKKILKMYEEGKLKKK